MSYKKKYLQYKLEYLKEQHGSSASAKKLPASKKLSASKKHFDAEQRSRDRRENHEYFINAHGHEFGSFSLPPLSRVIMLCSQNICWSSLPRTSRMAMKKFGSNLEYLIPNFLENEQDQDQDRVSPSESHRFCIFTSNYNLEKLKIYDLFNNDNVVLIQELFSHKQLDKKCPNLRLTNENKEFRTGIFQVPAKFNRVYHSNYTNSRGEFKKIGTIEEVDINEIFNNKRDAKIRGETAINRLEQLLVLPFPTIENKSRFKTEYSDASSKIQTDEDTQMYFASMMGIGSIIIPDSDHYNIFHDGSTVEEIITSNYDEINVYTTFISACRNKTDEEISLGIPLHEYNQRIIDTLPEKLREKILSDPDRYNFKNRNLSNGKNIFNLTYAEFDNIIYYIKKNKIPSYLLLPSSSSSSSLPSSLPSSSSSLPSSSPSSPPLP